jgi:peptidoglycan hydrolase-like protein with peptidoglycan-binding domain
MDRMPPAPGLLVAAWKRNLRVGTTGEDVRNLQLFLIRKGLLAPDLSTAYFGLKTKAAVILFQKANNVPGTGFVGPLTLKKLEELNK